MTMRKVHLHGTLRDKFGGPYKFDALTVRDIGSALCQVKGFREEVVRGQYEITVSGEAIRLEMDEEMLGMVLGPRITDVHITPVIAGEKSRGVGKIIVGVAIVASVFVLGPAAGPLVGAADVGAVTATGFAAGAATGLGATAFAGVTFGQIALFGASLALSGVSQLLAPSPKVSGSQARELADQRPSFLFNGPVNVAEQGHPIPLVYGIMRVGSVVVSAGLEVEQI